ncbi:hypothetical protein CsatB_024227 [Cannabis sativa]
MNFLWSQLWRVRQCICMNWGLPFQILKFYCLVFLGHLFLMCSNFIVEAHRLAKHAFRIDNELFG